MRRFATMVVVFVAVLASVALVATSAEAKPQKLFMFWVSESENTVVPGESFSMTLYHWNNESVGPNTFSVETSSGTATCTGTEFPFSGLGGKVLTNNESIDKVEMTESAGALAFGTVCPNSSPLGSEANVFVAPNSSILNLAGSKGKAELKAKSKTEPIYVEVAYSGGAFCVWGATKWKGALTFPAQGSWNQIEINFTKVKVKLAKEFSSTVCDKKTTISGSFGFQSRSDEGGFGEGHFIFGKLL